MWTKRVKPSVPRILGASSCLFIVDKKLLGQCCPYSSPSSHLMMQWQTTPAVQETRKEMMISIQTSPPPVAGYRLDNIVSIAWVRTNWNRRNNLPGVVSVPGGLSYFSIYSRAKQSLSSYINIIQLKNFFSSGIDNILKTMLRYQQRKSEYYLPFIFDYYLFLDQLL